jgi:hypothetical protein
MTSYEDKHLSTVKYKTGITVSDYQTTPGIIDRIDQMLDQEAKNNTTDTWPKIDKTTKIKKLREYTETSLTSENNLTAHEAEQCSKYLIKNINKGLRKSKDINYDVDIGVVVGIPNLIFNELSRTFSLGRTSAVYSGTNPAAMITDIPMRRRTAKATLVATD